MPRSVPDAATLIALVADCLESEVYPVVSGPLRYRVRIAQNVLRIVQRELGRGSALDAEEAEGLGRIWGTAEGEPPSIDALIRRIEGAKPPLDEAELRGFLRHNLERALEVNNPRWLERDRGDST